MAIITVMPYAVRTTTTLTTAEVWQVRGGPVLIQTTSPTNNTDGVEFASGDAHRFESGEVVTAWLAGNVGSLIVCMPVK